MIIDKIDIESLLEKKDRILYQILVYINTTNNTELSYEELYGVVHLSIITLNEMINELKEEINHLKIEDYLEVRVLSTSTYRLKKGKDFSVDLLLSKMLNRSMYFKILQDLFFDKNMTTEKYTQEFFISNSSLSRRFRQLRVFCQNIGIDIVKKNGVYILVGKEEQIRYFFYVLFRISRNFPQNEELVNSLTEELKKIYPSITQSTLDSFVLFFLVSKSRFSKGCLIESSVYDFIVVNRLFRKKDFVNVLRQYYHIILTEDDLDKEISSLYFFISTNNLLDMKTVLSVSAYLTPETLHDNSFSEANLIIYQMVCFLNIEFKPHEYFYLVANLYLILKKQERFLISADIDYNQFEENSKGYGLYSRFLEYFKKTTQREMMLGIGTLQIVFNEVLKKKGPNIKVLVCSKFGDRNKEIVEEKLSQLIFYPVIFVNRLSEQPDFIVTDYFLANTGDRFTIRIDNYSFHGDMKRVSELINLNYFEGEEGGEFK